MAKKGILLINLGTPDSPATKDVRKYLREFLMDKYVIDLPYLTRWFLVNVIIATFRAPKSAEIYKQVWTENGSPLLYFGLKVQKLLQEKLGSDIHVAFGMRYQNPSLDLAIDELKQKGIDDLVVIPMYPQWASSSTKSSIERTKELLKKKKYAPKLRFVENFVDNKKYITAIAQNGKKYWETGKYEKVLFSYHGVPERHVIQDCADNYGTKQCKLDDNCCQVYSDKNKLCYRAQCYENSRLIAEAMNLKPDDYVVAFQSRLETRARDPWLKPYSDIFAEEFPKEGIKNVLAFSPSFVADCLETTIEVGDEFKEIFEENGGETWQLVESLNDNPLWIEALAELSLSND